MGRLAVDRPHPSRTCHPGHFPLTPAPVSTTVSPSKKSIDLLEAPIVDLWVILSAVASVVAGMEAMMHLGAMVGGAGGCRAVLRACRTMRAFLLIVVIPAQNAGQVGTCGRF